MKQLVDLIYLDRDKWADSVRETLSTALQARYPRIPDLADKKHDDKVLQLRVNAMMTGENVPYAALIAPGQERSGGYGGASFVMFPPDEGGAPCLIGMVVGTNGLAPDEETLGRPGHARKCTAIASWLASRSQGDFAWAKRDPVRIDQPLPDVVKDQCAAWKSSLDKYGHFLYALYAPPPERTSASDEAVQDAVTAFVDLFFAERGVAPRAEAKRDADRIRSTWLSRTLPTTSYEEVTSLLRSRRFVILEGPPGTGKTEMARRLLRDAYSGFGRIIQFHPGTTYESLVGGLAPEPGGSMGFTFRPTPGHLLQAAIEASQDPGKPYLLVVDEINRADLAKVLGEAVYLFEPSQPDREVRLQYEFPELGSTLRLPANLHVVGTMNTADRSIAILDIAIRRRFAFVRLWPQLDVVSKDSPRLRRAFEQLVTLFLEHATDDAFSLLPGHAYFLGGDDEANRRLETEVRPLLEEYLTQGYVAGFSAEIRAFLDYMGRA